MKKPNNIEEIYIDGIHEYDYVKTETKEQTTHTLYYTEWYGWSEGIRSKKAIELIDSGSGMQVKNSVLYKEENYLKIEQLHIILRLSSQECTYQRAKPVVKINL